MSTLGTDAQSWGFGLPMLWRPPVDLGEKWSCAMSATIPYLTMDVSAKVVTTGPGGGTIAVKRSDSESGLGDVVLIPLMLNYNVDPDFNVNHRVAAYAPTGVDGTLAQHFPAFGGLAGVGVSAYYYKQLTADSGNGATLGDFDGKTVGTGPVVSYAGKANGHDVVAELKWLHETDTEKRLEGDLLWMKVLFKFY